MPNSKQELMGFAIKLAYENAQNQTGGPFGAVIYDPKAKRMVGFGSNKVVPNSDPTAHAEITAARDALTKSKLSNLEGLECYTSCECCPMCLSYLLDLGISKIYYAAKREDAAASHFSDEQQYNLLNAGYEANCRKTDLKIEPVSVIGEKTLPETDSTFALRFLCNEIRNFHLPENFTFVCEHKPHPYSLIALDWARVGRVRDAEYSDDPNMDSITKDTSKILYLNDEFETLSGSRSVDEILQIIKNSDPNIISQIPHPDQLKPFEIWNEQIVQNNAKKY